MNSKSVLLTGSSKGFGLLFAEELSKQELTVYATAREPKNAHKLHELSEKYKNLKILKLDVLNHQEIDSVFEEISKTQGKTLDVLINNVGYGLVGRLEDLPLEEIKQQFETNFFSSVAMTQKFLPLLNNIKDGGLIINISSIASFLGLPTMFAYSASKAAMDSFSMSVACENTKDKLSVATVHPGPYKTSFSDSAKRYGQIMESKNSFFQTQTDFQEVADLIVKLISLKSQGKLKTYSKWPIGKKTKVFQLLCQYMPASWLTDLISKSTK
ncbi:MAG: SDR family NAD(P)-dependent oxidoreductase [Candidatus Caenarcaniphilales bacterium]|nr:SDR family NAD(P)-dependent oxidoreductase [Candidatus Caenarcaniphilales bacterium]